jgi:hypothetical protein
MLHAGRSRFQFPMGSLNSSVHLILQFSLLSLGSTNRLTNICTKNLLRVKGRCVRLVTTLRMGALFVCSSDLQPQECVPPGVLKSTLGGTLKHLTGNVKV